MNVQSLGSEVILIRKFLIILLFVCTLFLCFVIPSFADEGVTSLADTPSDLTGYTVTVPAGWTAMPAYTTLELNCSFDNTVVSDTANPLTIKVGYAKNGSSYADSIQIINPYTEASYGLGNSYPITFVIGEGFQSNSTIFIQWLVDNNATFTSSEPEPSFDLNGYHVHVPYGWSSTAGYGRFAISGEIYNSDISFDELYIGWNFDPSSPGYPTSLSDHVEFLLDGSPVATYQPTSLISFYVTGGTDSSSSSLYQWLVENDSIFTPSDPPAPNPSVTLSAGNYYFNPSITYPYLSEWFDDGFTYSFTADGYYYVGSLPHHFTAFNYEFKSLTDDQNYHLVFSVDTDSDEVVPLYDIFCVNGRYTVDSLDGLTYFSLEEEVVLDLNSRTTFEHFFKTYVPDTPVFDGNPWSYILEMVIEALKVKIWGYFSIWDIVTTLCGIFIATWLLKLLAGG